MSGTDEEWGHCVFPGRQWPNLSELPKTAVWNKQHPGDQIFKGPEEGVGVGGSNYPYLDAQVAGKGEDP